MYCNAVHPSNALLPIVKLVGKLRVPWIADGVQGNASCIKCVHFLNAPSPIVLKRDQFGRLP